MEVTEFVKAHLSNEDIKKAIAEYASKYRAGEHNFLEETVRIFPENESDTIEVEAYVATSAKKEKD
jgi:hypothetical protein